MSIFEMFQSIEGDLMKYRIAALFCVVAIATYAEPHGKANVEVLAKTDRMWDGTPLPKYPLGDPEITILKVVIPARSELPMHRHPVINAGHLLSGERTVVSEEGREKTLRAGDTLVELVGKWHYGRNEGDVDVEILVFYAGEKDKPITVKKDES